MHSVCTPLAFPPQGRPGAAGPAGGYGTVDYTDLDAVKFDQAGGVTAGTPLPMVAGVWTRVIRNLSPSTSIKNPLRGPFASFVFWDGQRLRARAEGDILLFKISYRLISNLRGAGLRFAIRPGGDPAFDFGPQPITTIADAGTVESGSEPCSQTVRSRFFTQGAEIYVLSSSGGTLLEFSPEITPLDVRP